MFSKILTNLLIKNNHLIIHILNYYNHFINLKIFETHKKIGKSYT